MQLHCSETKLPNLMLKTRPKQLLGSLPLDIALPAMPCIIISFWKFKKSFFLQIFFCNFLPQVALSAVFNFEGVCLFVNFSHFCCFNCHSLPLTSCCYCQLESGQGLFRKPLYTPRVVSERVSHDSTEYSIRGKAGAFPCYCQLQSGQGLFRKPLYTPRVVS